MKKSNKTSLFIHMIVMAVVVLSACQSTAPEATQAVEQTAAAEATALAEPKTVDQNWPDMTWDEVIAEAEGQTVNFWHWGGDENWNKYFDKIIGDAVANNGVTINSVLIDDTVEAVNKVLSEVEAGRKTDGSVDVIWINGENFVTLQQANLLFGPYTEFMPNFANMDPNSTALDFDFGYPIDGYESPQGSSQFTMTYNSAMVTDPPKTVDGLLKWICDNPGQFTYPTLPTYTGREFVLEIFYRVTGGYEQWQGPWTPEMQALVDEKAPLLWDKLNEIKPCLWREGATYPADKAPMDDLFANGEIAWTFSAGSGESAAAVISGLFPETTVTMIFEDGTHNSNHYVAIPVNSPHKAAALLVANAILSCEVQFEKNQPSAVGDLPSIDISRCPDDIKQGFAAIDYGIGGISPVELGAAPVLPIGGPELATALEDGWRVNVLEKK